MAKKDTPQAPAAAPVDDKMPDWAKEEGAVAVQDQPQGGELVEDEPISYRSDAMTGAEFGRDDIAIPFIRVLQEESPQVKKRDPKYIEDAEAGMIFNTVTGRLYRESTNLETRQPDAKFPGVIIIPVAYTPSFVEWKPDRGGFVADHGANADILKKTRKGGKDNKEDVLQNGNTIARSGLYYVFIFDEVTGNVTEAAFALGGTGLTVSRKWNSNIKEVRFKDDKGSFCPAMYAMSYRVATFWDTDHTAGDFFNYRISSYKKTEELGPFGKQIVRAAAKFKKLIEDGGVKTAKDEEAPTGGSQKQDEAF